MNILVRAWITFLLFTKVKVKSRNVENQGCENFKIKLNVSRRGRGSVSHEIQPDGSILYLTLQFSSSLLLGGSTNSILSSAFVRNLLYLKGASERAFWVRMKDPATNSPVWQSPAGTKQRYFRKTITNHFNLTFTIFCLLFDQMTIIFVWSLNWWEHESSCSCEACLFCKLSSWGTGHGR